MSMIFQRRPSSWYWRRVCFWNAFHVWSQRFTRQLRLVTNGKPRKTCASFFNNWHNKRLNWLKFTNGISKRCILYRSEVHRLLLALKLGLWRKFCKRRSYGRQVDRCLEQPSCQHTGVIQLALRAITRFKPFLYRIKKNFAKKVKVLKEDLRKGKKRCIYRFCS